MHPVRNSPNLSIQENLKGKGKYLIGRLLIVVQVDSVLTACAIVRL